MGIKVTRIQVFFLMGVSLLAGCASQGNRTPDEWRSSMDRELVRLARKDDRMARAGMGLWFREEGEEGLVVRPGVDASPFHAASVGKLFTAILAGRLVDDGRLSLDQTVESVLGEGFLRGLVVPGSEALVTVGELLAHRSGMADYFDGPTTDGTSKVSELMISEPGRSWSPEDLLAHSRNHQAAGPRGDFHYSDTGFIVLGLVIESVYGEALEAVVHREIFEPLGMDASYYPRRSVPRNVGPGGEAPTLRPAWLGEVNVSSLPSITADWAGGGVATTEEDLLRLGRALADGRLLSPTTLKAMTGTDGKFNTGIRYGMGFMTLRFKEFFPLLGHLPDMVGHLGILGTGVFVDPVGGTVVVVNLGTTDRMEEAVTLIINAMLAR